MTLEQAEKLAKLLTKYSREDDWQKVAMEANTIFPEFSFFHQGSRFENDTIYRAKIAVELLK